MHPVDIIEDIAIAYGYDNFEIKHMESYTVGKTFPIIKFIDDVRELIIGAGYQEVMSAMLSNKKLMYDKMNINFNGIVELKEFISEKYSTVRSWILPIMMDVLSKNKHVEYPQKIFEEGLISIQDGKQVNDYHKVAVVSAHADANYTEARQTLDFILRSLGFDYKIEEVEHGSFIPGRVGRVIANGKRVAYVGELSPIVIKNFDLDVPVAGFELDLSKLFEIIKA